MAIEMKTTFPRPVGHHSITPGFATANAGKVIAFLEAAFAGKTIRRFDAPNGQVGHAEVLIGDSVVKLGDALAEAPMPASLSYCVATGEEVDATYRRAVAAGGAGIAEPKNQFFGYRTASVRDAGGNQWTIFAVVEQLTDDQIATRARERAS
jgi:PhnB protein